MIERYLLEASDNPFVRPLDAHHDISFACIAYLCTSLELIDPYLPEEQKMAKVGKGFHALQLYAHEHWITHLLTYLNLNDSEDGPSQPLMEQLINLCAIHKQMETRLSRTPNAGAGLHAADAGQDLHYVSNVEAREMVQATLRLRKLLKDEQRNTGEGMFSKFIWPRRHIHSLPPNYPVSSASRFLVRTLTYC